MMEQSIYAIAKACNGIIVNKGKVNTIDKISTDTRNIVKDSLFIPLIGENFDGHAFIHEAIKKGATSILVQEEKLDNVTNADGINIIQVKDTLEALAQIAHYYKKLFNIPFIAVTGSVGKTTTKDLIAGVLSNKYSVHKNIGNFNNEIGLPITLFNLENNHNISVLEMGMSSSGEILKLANIVHPHIAVITNIGLSHIECFNNKQNIMDAKMEITANLKKDDYLLVNGDDEYLRNINKKDKNYNVIFYGLGSHNDLYAEDVKNLGEEGSSFVVNVKGKQVQFTIKQLGLHNVYSALVAIWIGIKYNMTPEEIQKGLNNLKLSNMRLELINLGDVKIINDAYNASPDSMKAALDVLENIEANRKVAVLGNMFEMGSFSEKGHRDVGAYLANKKIDLLITVGELGNWIALEAREKGFKEENIYSVNKNEDATNILEKYLKNKDAVLVKGSRSMAMEEIAVFLQERSRIYDIGK